MPATPRPSSYVRRLLRATLLLAAAFPVPPSIARADEAGDKKKDEPWKITAEIGPSRDVRFTTDVGTWLGVDVHPDGKRLAFSLLGDLYLLPIGGGRATRITHGPAYDVQPRFSPDGRWIAFASDRGGLEALWICDLEGRNARQVSTEKTSQVNGPVWTPDGEYLLGRKRLTDTSSLGTVELWLWHLKGGEGVQLTKKAEQPDAADPTFSKDGRFIFFSARGSRYRYDRDVYEGIWQIKRLDRWTGQSIPLTGEFGGAACPALSPDGRTLAFVRRVDDRTRIELMDIATGRTRMLADSVQRDNQEGFAFHGTFPGYAWTPDGRGVVASAGGRLWRWEASSGARSAIPFQVDVEQRVTDAVRFKREIAGDQVRARVVRWATESPDGKTLVFSALGHLYSMRLPGGTPKRLTQGEDFEYCPSFSADGRSIAFVTWNDVEGGHVCTIPASGGRAKTLTTRPAQYANPAFSPDGKKVVFVRGSGATFRDRDPGEELWSEIQWIDAKGGESRYVIGTQSAVQYARFARPSFSADGERIFFLESGSGEPGSPPPSTLASVKLDGTDRRSHLKWKYAEDAVVSPDNRWVAFTERDNAYVTALTMSGNATVDVSPSGSALPVRQLSDEGGWWIQWADRGRRITWTYGPTFYRVALDSAIPTPEPEAEEEAEESGDDKEEEKKDEKKKEDALPEAEKIAIDLRLPRVRPTERVAYTGARIVTMHDDEVIERGTILVQGDRIVDVGPESSVGVPEDARVVDLYGKTVIPGLVDEHAHLHYSAQDIIPQRPWKYLANLAYGVTTTHDPSATSFEAFEQGAMVEAGILDGPRSFSTGMILYGADGPYTAVIKSLDDARHHIRRMKSLGAFTVKSYMHPARKHRQWILQAAREETVMVVPEGGGDLEADMTMVLDGHTTIEHALPIVPERDVVTLLARSRTAYTPTLLVAYGGPSGDKWFHQHYDLFRDERLKRFVPAQVIEPLGRRRDVMAPEEEWHHKDVAAGAKEVLRAGGMVCMGAHGQMQGLGSHWEMWAFAQGGMTPLEAIRVSTIMPARTLGLDHAIGSIEAGKLADFVVLDLNPLEKIENSDSVALVVKNGQAYTMEMLERVRP
jgi:Tol biopolymer transport system component/imidazolonepropionase-like amidohydrolase